MQQLLNAALLVATVAHDGQYDKAGKPYILHVLRVYQNLNSTDEELNCIAILHDVIEDTKTTYADLREIGMPDRVERGVKLMTKVPGQTNEEYLAGILSSEDAMLVKKADLEDNMDVKRLKGVTDKDIARMNKYVLMYHAIEKKLKESSQPVILETSSAFVGKSFEVPDGILSDFEADPHRSIYKLSPVPTPVEPVKVEPKTYPKTIKDLVNQRFSKPAPETIVHPVVRAPKEGDTVRLIRHPRDAWGAEQVVSKDVLPYTFTLGVKNRLQIEGQWQGFYVVEPWLTWVRSDDVEVVE